MGAPEPPPLAENGDVQPLGTNADRYEKLEGGETVTDTIGGIVDDTIEANGPPGPTTAANGRVETVAEPVPQPNVTAVDTITATAYTLAATAEVLKWWWSR